MVDDGTLLAELMAEVKEDKTFGEGVETSREPAEKRAGGEVSEEDQSPAKAIKESPRKFTRMTEPPTSSASASNGARDQGDAGTTSSNGGWWSAFRRWRLGFGVS